MGRLAVTYAVALAAVAGPGRAAPEAPAQGTPAPRPDLVAVSRAMTALDQLAARGSDGVQEERRRRAAAADEAPRDVVARFLAVWAQPRGEPRWSGFKEIARRFPGSALGQVGMASVYVEWKVLDQADAAVARALAAEPDCWLALLVRAAAAERRGDCERAAPDFRTVLIADRQNPEAHLGLARCARSRGDVAVARAQASAALDAVPGHLGALALLSELGDDESDEEGRHLGTVALLAELGEEAGDADEATWRWSQLVEANAADRDARLRLAVRHRAAGRPDLARDQLRAAAALREDAETVALLADAARAANDPRGEQEAMARLAALGATAVAWRAVAELDLAVRDLDGADRAIRRVLAGDPRDASGNALLGRLRLRRGQPQEAVEALRAAGEPGRVELAALERRLNLERLSAPDVNQLERAVQAAVDRTFRARAAGVPSLSGAVRFRVTVNPAGEATLVEVIDDTLADADVRACAYWNLRDAAYPPSRPGRFTFRFSFAR